MIYLISSVAILTLIFSYLYKKRITAVCPICISVVITWVLGVISLYANMKFADPLFIGLLMAGSVGAAAERYGQRLGLWWKSGFVLIGLAAVYTIIIKDLALAIFFGAFTMALIYPAFRPKSDKPREDMFRNCC